MEWEIPEHVLLQIVQTEAVIARKMREEGDNASHRGILCASFTGSSRKQKIKSSVTRGVLLIAEFEASERENFKSPTPITIADDT